MRPFLWGTIWFVIGLVGWVIFSVLAGTIEGLSGESAGGVLTFLVYAFGLLFFLSLPVAAIWELVRWLRHRKAATATTPLTVSPPPTDKVRSPVKSGDKEFE